MKVKSERAVAQSGPTPPHGLQPTRLLHPWDFPGKSTGVGCHCLLPEGTQKPKFYRVSYLKVIMVRHEFVVLAKVNFQSCVEPSIPTIAQVHLSGPFCAQIKTLQHLFHPFLGSFPPRTNCLNYQVFDHLLVVASLKFS